MSNEQDIIIKYIINEKENSISIVSHNGYQMVKYIRNLQNLTQERKKEIENDILLVSKFSHKNIIQYYDIKNDILNNILSFYTIYYHNGTLYDVITMNASKYLYLCDAVYIYI